MNLGFTGTQRGMTRAQLNAVDDLLSAVPDFIKLMEDLRFDCDRIWTIHHGDCIGADAQLDSIAKDHNIFRHIHPATGKNKRAWCAAQTIDDPLPPLKRNAVIVQCAVAGLIAAPGQATEIVRSGTWATVRYARKLKRHIWIVRPNGTIVEENK